MNTRLITPVLIAIVTVLAALLTTMAAASAAPGDCANVYGGYQNCHTAAR